MSKAESIKGVLKMFWSMAKEDFGEMDHKFLRIAVGVGSFAAAALFWLFFLRHIIPF